MHAAQRPVPRQCVELAAWRHAAHHRQVQAQHRRQASEGVSAHYVGQQLEARFVNKIIVLLSVAYGWQ
jgi:hypothetical protein